MKPYTSPSHKPSLSVSGVLWGARDNESAIIAHIERMTPPSPESLRQRAHLQNVLYAEAQAMTEEEKNAFHAALRAADAGLPSNSFGLGD